MAHLPDVEAFLRKFFKGYAEIAFQQCKALMVAVASRPDRASGLGEALRLDEDEATGNLRDWAIEELGEMNTRDSRVVLEKFIRDAKAARGDRLYGTRLARSVESAELHLKRLEP